MDLLNALIALNGMSIPYDKPLFAPVTEAEKEDAQKELREWAAADAQQHMDQLQLQKEQRMELEKARVAAAPVAAAAAPAAAAEASEGKWGEQ